MAGSSGTVTGTACMIVDRHFLKIWDIACYFRDKNINGVLLRDSAVLSVLQWTTSGTTMEDDIAREICNSKYLGYFYGRCSWRTVGVPWHVYSIVYCKIQLTCY